MRYFAISALLLLTACGGPAITMMERQTAWKDRCLALGYSEFGAFDSCMKMQAELYMTERNNRSAELQAAYEGADTW